MNEMEIMINYYISRFYADDTFLFFFFRLLLIQAWSVMYIEVTQRLCRLGYCWNDDW